MNQLLISFLLTGLIILSAGCSREARKERFLDRANQHFEAGEYEKAAIDYLNVLRFDPNHEQAVQRIGIAYFESRDLRRAYPYLLKAEQQEPANLEIKERIGLVHLAANQFEQAAETAEFILQNDPGNTKAFLLLADTAQTDEKIERAQALLGSIEERAADQAAYHLALGALYYKSSDLEAAEQAYRQAYHLDPDSPQVLQALGNFYFATKDLETAEHFFRSAAQRAPEQPMEKLRLIEFKARTGDLAEAKEMLAELEAANPDYVPALLYRARVALQEQDYDKCAEYAKKVLERDRSNLDARLLRVRAALAQGDASRARKDLEGLRERHPKSPVIHHYLALAHLAENDLNRAANRLDEALNLNPEHDESILLLAQINLRRGDAGAAIELLEQLKSRQPAHVQANLLLAGTLAASGRPAEAASIYEELMEIHPGNPEIPFSLATLYRQQNRNERARAMFERALELAPQSLRVLSSLVEMDILEKRFDESHARLRKLIEEHPGAAALNLLVAQLHLAQNEKDQAEKALGAALALNQDFRAAHLLLSQLYAQSDREELALAQLNTLLEKNPDDEAALLQKATILQNAGDFAGAAEAYENLVRVNPRLGAAYNNLAYLYAEHLGNLDRAFDLAQQARQLLSSNPHVADTLGWIFFKRKEYDRALPLLIESAQNLPDKPEVLYHLGMTHYMMGQEEAARSAMAGALALETEFAHKPAAREKLAVLGLKVDQMSPADVERLENRYSQTPADVIAGLKLAQLYQQQGRIEEAGKHYEQLLQQNSRLVPALVNLAQLYARDPGRRKDAADLLQQALSLEPNDPRISHLLGRLTYEMGNYRGSLALLEESARRRRQDPELQFDLGMAYLAMGRLNDSEVSIKSSLGNSSSFSRADQARETLALLELYRTPAQAKGQREEIRGRLQASPGFLPALLALGRLEEHEGRVEQARSTYEDILRKYPDFAPAARDLARIYSGSGGDLNRAYELAIQARETLPGDPELMKTFAKIVYLRGNFRHAVLLLEECANVSPDDAEVFYYLGMSNYRLKNEEETRLALTRAITLRPEAAFSSEARETLAQLDQLKEP
jgi:tetratricopeptide (TPR) repeat protein